MKIPNSSDVLLTAFASVLSVCFWFVAAHSAILRHWKAAGAGAFFATFCLAVAFAALQRLRHLQEERNAFLARLEGRAIDDAVSIAQAEAVALPSGLVAEKVNIPFHRWSAYERGAFQFVIASDEQGRARTFPI